MAPSLSRAVRSPSGISDFFGPQSYAEITNLFQKHLDLPSQESGLLASFSIARGWSQPPDCTEPGDHGLQRARHRRVILNCVCRHSLILAEVTPSGLRSLPTELVLICSSISKNWPNLQRLFRASNFRGLNLFGNGGRLIDLYGPKAVLYKTMPRSTPLVLESFGLP